MTNKELQEENVRLLTEHVRLGDELEQMRKQRDEAREALAKQDATNRELERVMGLLRKQVQDIAALREDAVQAVMNLANRMHRVLATDAK